MTGQYSALDSIGALSPRRSTGSQFIERLVRKQPWLFIHNEITGQHVRLNDLASQVVRALDGRQSVESLLGKLGPDAQSTEREAVATTLLTLAQLGMVDLGVQLSDQLIQQRAIQLAQQKSRPWHNPLAVKLPLFDPDVWLTRILARLGGFMGVTLLWFSASIVVLGIALGILNASEIGSQMSSLARTPQQWWQIVLIYPILKCLHEFAHGIVIKHFKGNCHEAGITVLILMPVPYVDATDIWRFERRYQRILVSAAGMLAEGVCAALGLLIWLTVEPGLLADLAFAVALTGSVSTVLFNANPLLKFDGYQILQDALDIPNLAPRSSRYISYLCKRYLLSVDEVRSPVTGVGERPWLFSYAVCAASYRWVITLGIALYLVTRFPVIGGILAIFALYKLAITPCIALLRYLLTSAELQHKRIRAGSISASVVVALVCLVFVMPVPSNTRAQGIVDVPHQAQLFAPQTGELAEIYVAPGDTIEPGQPVLRIAAPDLTTKSLVIQSQLDVLETEYQAAIINSPALIAPLLQDITEKRVEVDQINTDLASLVIHSGVAGRVSLAERFTRIGEYVDEGVVLGHIVNAQDLLIKAVVRESDIARVEEGVTSVNIRLAERFAEPFPARLSFVTPAATRSLPSQALAAHISPGGIAVASSEQSEWKTVEPVFQLEFELPENTDTVGIGGRAYITLSHNAEPIGIRSWRALRRLVLEELAL